MDELFTKRGKFQKAQNIVCILIWCRRLLSQPSHLFKLFKNMFYKEMKWHWADAVSDNENRWRAVGVSMLHNNWTTQKKIWKKSLFKLPTTDFTYLGLSCLINFPLVLTHLINHLSFTALSFFSTNFLLPSCATNMLQQNTCDFRSVKSCRG